MQTTRSKIEYLPTTILIVGGMLLWLLSSGGVATAGYADSAHGNESYGVNRSTATCQNWPDETCVTGSCAHCHDTFDPNICENDLYGLMLFAPNDNPTPTPQSDNFCFQCHTGIGTYCWHAPGNGSCTATWTPDLVQAGNYKVYAWFDAGVSGATNAEYTVYYDGGSTTIEIDQNGSQSIYLGNFPFDAGTSGSVVLSDYADWYVIAEAIKWQFDNPICLSFDVIVDNPAFVCDWTCLDPPAAWPGLQVGGITNNTYSTNFGGGAATMTTIYDAFNAPGSSHNLSDVLNHAVGRDIGFASDTNPCLVCHDQHLAQQNYPVTLSGLGGVKTAIRRPADYQGRPGNLWGDEDATSGLNERMRDFTAKYQAPYYAGGFNYEPADDGTADGSNLPNSQLFCRNQCHAGDKVYSTDHGRDLVEIDWGTGSLGNIHGKQHDDNYRKGYNIAPYTRGETYNYVLACTDCHEPHGSPNEWLLRTCVNGKDNITIRWVGDWWEFCTACHVVTGLLQYHYKAEEPPCSGSGCKNCHRHDLNIQF